MTTPEQLRDFAREHLLYEVRMLRRLTVALKDVLDHREAGGDIEQLYPLEVRNARWWSRSLSALGS